MENLLLDMWISIRSNLDDFTCLYPSIHAINPHASSFDSLCDTRKVGLWAKNVEKGGPGGSPFSRFGTVGYDVEQKIDSGQNQ